MEIMQHGTDHNDTIMAHRSVAPVGGSNDNACRTQGSLRFTLGYIPSPPPEAKNTNKNENIRFTTLHGIQPIKV